MKNLILLLLILCTVCIGAVPTDYRDASVIENLSNIYSSGKKAVFLSGRINGNDLDTLNITNYRIGTGIKSVAGFWADSSLACSLSTGAVYKYPDSTFSRLTKFSFGGWIKLDSTGVPTNKYGFGVMGISNKDTSTRHCIQFYYDSISASKRWYLKINAGTTKQYVAINNTELPNGVSGLHHIIITVDLSKAGVNSAKVKAFVNGIQKTVSVPGDAEAFPATTSDSLFDDSLSIGRVRNGTIDLKGCFRTNNFFLLRNVFMNNEVASNLYHHARKSKYVLLPGQSWNRFANNYGSYQADLKIVDSTYYFTHSSVRTAQTGAYQDSNWNISIFPAFVKEMSKLWKDTHVVFIDASVGGKGYAAWNEKYVVNKAFAGKDSNYLLNHAAYLIGQCGVGVDTGAADTLLGSWRLPITAIVGHNAGHSDISESGIATDTFEVVYKKNVDSLLSKIYRTVNDTPPYFYSMFPWYSGLGDSAYTPRQRLSRKTQWDMQGAKKILFDLCHASLGTGDGRHQTNQGADTSGYRLARRMINYLRPDSSYIKFPYFTRIPGQNKKLQLNKNGNTTIAGVDTVGIYVKKTDNTWVLATSTSISNDTLTVDHAEMEDSPNAIRLWYTVYGPRRDSSSVKGSRTDANTFTRSSGTWTAGALKGYDAGYYVGGVAANPSRSLIANNSTTAFWQMPPEYPDLAATIDSVILSHTFNLPTTINVDGIPVVPYIADLSIDTPVVDSIRPLKLRRDSIFTIRGIGFGSTQGSGYVSINDTVLWKAQFWSDTMVIDTVKSTLPRGLHTVKIYKNNAAISKTITNGIRVLVKLLELIFPH